MLENQSQKVKIITCVNDEEHAQPLKESLSPLKLQIVVIEKNYSSFSKMINTNLYISAFGVFFSYPIAPPVRQT